MILRDIHWIIGLFYLDRINWIDLIFFHGFRMKPRKRNSASAEKRGRGDNKVILGDVDAERAQPTLSLGALS